MPENQMAGKNGISALRLSQPDGRRSPGFYSPQPDGTLVYLNCQPDLQIVLNTVEPAGGKILQEKKEISSQQHLGLWALILDIEGNRVALHSMG